MIVIDSSIFMALAQTEPGSDAYVAPIRRARTRVMSAGNYLECGILARTRLGGPDVLDGWVQDEAIRIVPVDVGLARIAADAFARYGKGRHPAGLNFGDCFAYALARSLGAPLLFKGDDFARTDIPSALLA